MGLPQPSAPAGMYHRTLFCSASEAALDDLCVTETEVEDTEMDCG